MSKFARIAFYAFLIGCTIQTAVAQVTPVPLTFQFTFCEGLENDAQARGWVTFDQNLMSNPFQETIELPGPMVLGLEVDVTNALVGNGHFVLSDFGSMYWESNGGTLDFGQELVGQPTNDLPWGTLPSEGQAGDFNLFGTTEGAPVGQWYFTLAAGGLGEEGPGAQGEDLMVLVSMVPGGETPGTAVCNVRNPESAPVPTINDWGKTVMFLLFAGFAGIALRRQIKQSTT